MVAMGLCVACPVVVLAQVTDLKVTKSGNDAVLQWTTGHEAFTASASNNDAQFREPRTLAIDLPGPPGTSPGTYTYAGALNNGVTLQFFQVCASDENCMAWVFTGGAPPPVAPNVTTTSSGSGVKVGDVLTINGQGFSDVAIDNLVHFSGGITATPSTATSSSMQVQVPRGAMSASVVVQVGHQFSDPWNLVVNAQDSFVHIYGAYFQPDTKDIWLTDGGSGSGNTSKTYSMTYNGTTGIWDKTIREQAPSGTNKYLGGQGIDAGGYYYYGYNNAAANGGVRRIPTNPPGSPSAFTQVFPPPSSDTVSVAALATSPAFPDIVFVAYNDTSTGYKGVRKLQCTSLPCSTNGVVLDPDYGGFGSPGPALAPIAGMALDSSNNLYLSATTQILKITPSEVVTTVCTGFNRAEGISLLQAGSGDSGTLLVVDNGTSTLYAVDLNQASPTPRAVLSGLSVPRTAAFGAIPLASSTCGTLPNTDVSLGLMGEDTRLRQIPNPVFTLSPSTPTKVWISKHRTLDTYPSPAQNADHQITVTATVTPAPSPARYVCFRVADPPDKAPSFNGTSDSHWCDNKDADVNAGKLWNSSTSSWESAVCVQTNVSGQASVTLNTTARYAGDNYVVQASLDTWPNPTEALVQTGIITAWKRVYFEKDKMFRQGGLLSQDAEPNDVVVTVNDGAFLPPCGGTPGGSPCYQIALFDTEHPYENPTMHEEPYVSHVTPAAGGGLDLHLVSADMFPYALTYLYTHSTYPDFTDGHSAGVGVKGFGFYEADIWDTWKPFSDGFVEFQYDNAGSGALPYVEPGFFDGFVLASGATCTDVHIAPADPPYDFGPVERFGWMWFSHHADLNYIWLGGAGMTAQLDICQVCANTKPMPQYLGLTHGDQKLSFVFTGAIEEYCYSPSQTTNAIRDATVHEAGHDFYLNPTVTLGHDTRCQWIADGPLPCSTAPSVCASPLDNGCLMNGSADPFGYKHRFDRFDLLCGDSGCPSGQQHGCCDACVVKGNGSIRQLSDPLVEYAP